MKQDLPRFLKSLELAVSRALSLRRGQSSRDKEKFYFQTVILIDFNFTRTLKDQALLKSSHNTTQHNSNFKYRVKSDPEKKIVEHFIKLILFITIAHVMSSCPAN